MPCPTVRVKDDHSPDGYIIINESDLTDKHEVIQPECATEPSVQPEVVVQSIAQPIGQPTVMDHTTNAPFYRQAAPGQTVVLPGGTAIPTDWEDMHWKRQVKLARRLGYPETGRELSGDKAKAFIRLKVAERDIK